MPIPQTPVFVRIYSPNKKTHDKIGMVITSRLSNIDVKIENKVYTFEYNEVIICPPPTS
jgi:hypothetical protein